FCMCIRIKREYRGEVGFRRSHQPKPILFGGWVGALVRTDQARTVVRDPHPAEESLSDQLATARQPVSLSQGPERRLLLLHDDGAASPLVEEAGRTAIPVLAVLRKIDVDDVVGTPRGELGPCLG